MPNPTTLRRMRLAMQAGSVPRGGPHEVRELRGYPLREPVSGRRYTVVCIETVSGLRGYGECGRILNHEFSRATEAVTGASASALEPLRARLAFSPGLQAAVNMALLDVLGQIAEAPVHQVLGGPTRNKARALAPLEGDSDDDLRESMERAMKAGYRAFTVPLPAVRAPNQGQAFVHGVRRRLEALRAAAGNGADFVLDGGGKLTPGDAASISEALERFHLLWFDEPCRVSPLGAVRKLSEENVTPLGFGRHIHHGAEFQDLLRESAIDVLRPSVSLNGITQIRRMAALAETYYVAVAPFHDGGPVATAAALHLAASLPNFSIQQIPLPSAAKDRRMRAELTSGSIETVGEGFAQLPAGPGLGIRVSKEALTKYEAA